LRFNRLEPNHYLKNPHPKNHRRHRMIQRSLTLPEILLIAGTRVALGIGIGLLLSNRLNEDQRRGAGLALVVVGAATTIPIAISILGKKSPVPITDVDLREVA
jgi:hypothetical protein